jgi:hypothetical protein
VKFGVLNRVQPLAKPINFPDVEPVVRRPVRAVQPLELRYAVQYCVSVHGPLPRFEHNAAAATARQTQVTRRELALTKSSLTGRHRGDVEGS